MNRQVDWYLVHMKRGGGHRQGIRLVPHVREQGRLNVQVDRHLVYKRGFV